MSSFAPDHYAVLGLDPRCSDAQIRAAYRLLAKRHHPDLNDGVAEANAFTQALNAAYEVLGDAERRRAYDEARDRQKRSRVNRGAAAPKGERNIRQDVHLRIEEFLRGTSLEIRVADPANLDGAETYPVQVPPETSPGTILRVPRTGCHHGGQVLVRLKARPDYQFKVRGSDLRCDLRISAARASQGGSELVRGAGGTQVRVAIPRGVARGKVVRVPGAGLPKARGGRGDLLVRILYRVPVQVTRSPRR